MSPTGTRAPGDGPLRITVTGSVVAALVTLSVAGLLPVPGLLLLLPVLLGAAWAGWRFDAAQHLQARVLASLALVAAGALVAARLGSTDRLVLVPAAFLALLAAAQAVRQETVRDLLVSLAPALAMVLVAVSLGAGRGRALPLVATQLLVLASLALAVPLGTAHRLGHQPGVVLVRAVPGGTANPAPVWPRAFLAAGTALLAGAVLYLLVPASLLPEGGRGASSSSRTGGPFVGTAAAADRTAGGYSSGALDMHARGTLSEEPLLDVPAGSPPLWRGTALDRYDGRRWSGSFGDGQEPARSDDVPWPFEVDTGDTDVATYDVRPVGGRLVQAVHAPGTAVRVRGGGPFAVIGEQVFWTGDDGASTPYVVDVVQPRLSYDQLSGAAPSAARYDTNTALPADLPQRVRDLALSLTAAAPTMYDKVLAVEQHLRSSYRYTLDSRVPAQGEDAVDAFLFVDREGFCEQFAAAEVVLLRSLGIPARMATGLSQGTVADGRRVFRDSDAHAWVEVRYDGLGWVPSDPTAGAEVSEPSRLRAVLDRLESALRSSRGRLLLAIGLVALAGAGVALLRVHARRHRAGDDREAPSVQRHALLAAFGRLEVALTQAGAARRPAETLGDLAARLDGPATALAVVERASFSGAPVPAGEAMRAADELDRITMSLLAGRAG